jgi:hypothetical protein
VEVGLIPKGSRSDEEFDAIFETWHGKRLSDVPGFLGNARQRAARANEAAK